MREFLALGIFVFFLSVLVPPPSDAQALTREQSDLLNECRTEADNAYACELAGNAFRTGSTGFGTTVHKIDLYIAREAYELGCTRESLDACTGFGEMSRLGEGGPIDLPKAAIAFQQVCDFDHTNNTGIMHNQACFQWGLLALNGAGPEPDPATAYTAFSEGCSRKFFEACTYMIVLEFEGHGANPQYHGNYAAQLQRLRNVCAQFEEPNACFTLGNSLRRAPEEFKDPALAFEATRRGCKDGAWPVACLEFAKMVRDGEGIPANPESASRVMTDLCQRGFAPACEEAGFTRNPASAAGSSETPADQTRIAGSIFRDRLQSGGFGPEMVVLSEGVYTMGSTPGDKNWYKEQTRQISIPRPFAVGRYEVTVAEWNACVTAGGCDASELRKPRENSASNWDQHPVTSVSWVHAQDYLKWMSQASGKSYRLLSEAEWEYAARAGTKTRFSWGDEDPVCDEGAPNRAAFNACGRRVHPVGFSAENPFGLFDMHGNAREWVADCVADYTVDRPSDGSALFIEDCELHVIRDGSGYDEPPYLEPSFLFAGHNTHGMYEWGFRVARDLSH